MVVVAVSPTSVENESDDVRSMWMEFATISIDFALMEDDEEISTSLATVSNNESLCDLRVEVDKLKDSKLRLPA